MTREEIKDKFEHSQLRLTGEALELAVDRFMDIADRFVRPEYNEEEWFDDFLLGVLIAASCEGDYTVTR